MFPDDQLAALSSTGDPFAVGGGTAEILHFAFSARLSPNGPSGYAVLRDPALGEAQGDVVCFRETTVGQVVFYIEKKKGSGFFGSRAFVGIFAQDSGVEPPSGDAMFASPTFSVGSCVLDGGFGGPVTQGNIVVKG